METNITVIDFDVELAKQILSGQKKGCFVTRSGYPAAINSLNCVNCQIIGHKISYTVICGDHSYVYSCFENGLVSNDDTKNQYDLMIQVDEAEIAQACKYKDGDILVSDWSGSSVIYIYRENEFGDPLACYCACGLNSNIIYIKKYARTDCGDLIKDIVAKTIRQATTAERMAFIDKMKAYTKKFAFVSKYFDAKEKEYAKEICLMPIELDGKLQPQQMVDLKNGDVIYYKDKFQELIYIYRANDDNNLFKYYASVYFEPNSPVFGAGSITPNKSSEIRRANAQEINFLVKQVIANKSICHDLASKGLFAVKVSVGKCNVDLSQHEYYTILKDSHNGQQTT